MSNVKPGSSLFRVGGALFPPATFSVRSVQIPTEGGHLFRLEGGRHSDLKAATIPI